MLNDATLLSGASDNSIAIVCTALRPLRLLANCLLITVCHLSMFVHWPLPQGQGTRPSHVFPITGTGQLAMATHQHSHLQLLTRMVSFSPHTEKLLNSSGRELRRALFSLKQIFQVRQSPNRRVVIRFISLCSNLS